MSRLALVVDDEPSIRLTLRAILNRAGFTVHTASSAETAKALLGWSPFDLVVTDLKMEDDTAGFQVADCAGMQVPRPFIVLLSAFPQLADHWQAHSINAFFEKPTNLAELLNAIEKHFARQNVPAPANAGSCPAAA